MRDETIKALNCMAFGSELTNLMPYRYQRSGIIQDRTEGGATRHIQLKSFTVMY
jgi:hypothetical protein